MKTDKLNEIGFADWNKKSLDEMVQHLEAEFGYQSTGTAKAIFTLIEYYHKTKQSHKLPVMRPASASAVGGELLPAEGVAQNGSEGECTCVNSFFKYNKCSDDCQKKLE